MTETESTRSNGDASHTGPETRRARLDPLMQVRAADLEPYTGLGYLSKLFRLIAIFLVLLLLLEVGTGLYQQGSEALPTLLSEVSRLVVLAGLLWGVGDLANLLIDVGHDVRAARILLGRQVAHATGDRSAERVRTVERGIDGGGESADAADADRFDVADRH
jgi:hypothetical protein